MHPRPSILGWEITPLPKLESLYMYSFQIPSASHCKMHQAAYDDSHVLKPHTSDITGKVFPLG